MRVLSALVLAVAPLLASGCARHRCCAHDASHHDSSGAHHHGFKHGGEGKHGKHGGEGKGCERCKHGGEGKGCEHCKHGGEGKSGEGCKHGGEGKGCEHCKHGKRHGQGDEPRPHGSHAEHAHPGGMPHRFDHAEEWSKRFDSPERDAWQQPDKVIAALELAPGAVVADLGAGTGYFASRIARAHPRVRVLGLDVEPDMVRFMSERAKRENLPNFDAQRTPADAAAIGDATSLVLVVDTYHHLPERIAYFKALRAKLGPQARLAVIDFKLDSPKGPPREHKLAPEAVVSELKAAGFVELKRHDFLPDQYFLVFGTTK